MFIPVFPFWGNYLSASTSAKLNGNPRKGKVFNRRNNRIYPGNSWMPIVSWPSKQLVHIKKEYQWTLWKMFSRRMDSKKFLEWGQAKYDKEGICFF